jgi:hypothetical protein
MLLLHLFGFRPASATDGFEEAGSGMQKQIMGWACDLGLGELDGAYAIKPSWSRDAAHTLW